MRRRGAYVHVGVGHGGVLPLLEAVRAPVAVAPRRPGTEREVQATGGEAARAPCGATVGGRQVRYNSGSLSSVFLFYDRIVYYFNFILLGKQTAEKKLNYYLGFCLQQAIIT